MRASGVSPVRPGILHMIRSFQILLSVFVSNDFQTKMKCFYTKGTLLRIRTGGASIAVAFLVVSREQNLFRNSKVPVKSEAGGPAFTRLDKMEDLFNL